VGVAGVLSTLESGTLEVFVYDASAPNAITTALPLVFAGQVVHLVSNDQTDYLSDTACIGRVRSVRMVVLAATTTEFLVAWSTICLAWYAAPAIGLGVRNLGIGLATAALVRALGDSPVFVVAPLFWMFPAILPGEGVLGEVLGVALRSSQPGFDAVLGALLAIVAIALLIFLSDIRSRRR